MPPSTRSQSTQNSQPLFPNESVVDLTNLNQYEQTPRLRSSRRSTQTTVSSNAAVGQSDPIQVFTIDQSLPPSQRYVVLAQTFRIEVAELPKLFADLIEAYIHPKCPVKPFLVLSRLFLRRLYSEEETEEISGISRATGVSMYLLVAFNLLLDLLMGCSSGGVLVRDKNDQSKTRMLHYRTLDWIMDPLRDIVVQLDFVRGAGNPVIAQTITYVGYTGILTGVRKGLSISLNFRAEHDRSTFQKNLAYYWHGVMVLLGRRPSISAVLRTHFLSDDDHASEKARSLDWYIKELSSVRTPSAFLIMSDGEETVVLEKDFTSAKILRSNSFIAATNSDESYDDSNKIRSLMEKGKGDAVRRLELINKPPHNWLIAESAERKKCMRQKWEDAVRRHRKDRSKEVSAVCAVTEQDVIRWMNDWPITNECTHFSCIMDPTNGTVRWCKIWLEIPADPHRDNENATEGGS